MFRFIFANLQQNEGSAQITIVKFNIIMTSFRVTTAQGKQGKHNVWPKRFPVRENTGNLEMLSKHRENTGNFVSSSCKLPDFQ